METGFWAFILKAAIVLIAAVGAIQIYNHITSPVSRAYSKFKNRMFWSRMYIWVLPEGRLIQIGDEQIQERGEAMLYGEDASTKSINKWMLDAYEEKVTDQLLSAWGAYQNRAIPGMDPTKAPAKQEQPE